LIELDLLLASAKPRAMANQPPSCHQVVRQDAAAFDAPHPDGPGDVQWAMSDQLLEYFE
jgi:hypothetical protein